MNQLLIEIDGIDKLPINQYFDQMIIIIGSTNWIDLIDKALIWSGRIDELVKFNKPTKKEIKQILKINL